MYMLYCYYSFHNTNIPYYENFVTIETPGRYENYTIVTRARTQEGKGNGVATYITARSFPGGKHLY